MKEGIKLKTVLTQQELSKRWGVTVKALTEWRNSGVLQPIKGIPSIRFSLEYINKMEEVTPERFSPLERKRLEKEIEILQHEKSKLQQVLNNILVESSKIIQLSQPKSINL